MNMFQTQWLATLVRCASFVLVASQPAQAEDLFIKDVARDIKKGEWLPPGTTIGGYAFFEGDNNWRLVSNTVTPANQAGVVYGSAHVYRPLGQDYFAEMVVTVNLTQSARGFYMTSDPCAGEHLVKVNKVAASVGEGTWDNCMTIDPLVITVQGKQITTLSINVKNVQSQSRYYHMQLLLNPATFGVGETIPVNARDTALAAYPQLKRFLERLTPWAKKLQDATAVAIKFEKPGNAFAAVPKWWELMDNFNLQGQPAPVAPATNRTPAPVN